MSAYSQQRVRKIGEANFKMQRAPVFLIEEARVRLERMLGSIPDWRGLTRFLPSGWTSGYRRRTAVASTFSAMLELARDGRVVVRQMTPFGEIYLRDANGAAGEDRA